MQPSKTPKDESPKPPRSRVWIWIVVVVVAQWIAWTAWFIVAAHHPVKEVPLATGP